MSFTKAFREKLRAVRIRCGVNVFLRQAGWVLALAGAVAIPAVLVDRLLAVDVMVPRALWVFWGVAAGLVILLWLLRFPSRMQASLLLDERLKLRERFSTTLALADSDDPFARAARAESLDAIRRVDVRGHFPIGPSRSCYYGAGVWLVAIGLILFMPEKDLLGLLRKKQQEQQKTAELEQARTEVREAVEPLKAVVKQMGSPEMEKELEKLEELMQAGQPQEIKREAIKALGDLSERIKQMQGSAQLDAANMLQETLKRLRGSPDPFSQQMRAALAKGDFAQAANMLSQMQKQLAEGSMPDQQRKEMAKQLQALAQELQKLAEQKRGLEDELEKLGLDKKLARMSKQQLQQALQNQGLRPEQIEDLMKKMAACEGAGGLCAALGQALAGGGGGAGGLSADDLSDAIEQLSALESLQQQMVLLQAGYDQLSQCMGCLGEGLGPGSCQSPFSEGLSEKYGAGSGGPGRGFGPRGSDTDGQTATKSTRLNKESGEGPVIASWYFKDIQVKGESRRQFSEVVEAGRASAAEAINENQIPRKYEDAMKKYFGQLEESGPKP